MRAISAAEPRARFGCIEQRAAKLDEHLHSSPAVSGESENEVHILDRLSGGALHEVVDRADHHGAPRRGIELHADVAEVGALDGAQVG